MPKKEPEMQYVRLPDEVVRQMRQLDFERPSDSELAAWVLANPEATTVQTLRWCRTIIARGGTRFKNV